MILLHTSSVSCDILKGLSPLIQKKITNFNFHNSIFIAYLMYRYFIARLLIAIFYMNL